MPTSRPRPPRATLLSTRHLLRLPLVWWVAAGLLAVVTASTVASLVGSAARARDAYGRTTSVVVVQRTVAAGEVLRDDDVAVVTWPRSLVPSDALHAPPVGRAARVDLVEGEVLVRSRLAPRGRSGVAAIVPPGWRAIAVPDTAGPFPEVAVGDRVDVLVTADTDGDAPTVVVADRAVVVDVAAGRVTVAVRAADATRVAYGVAAGAVTLAVVG